MIKEGKESKKREDSKKKLIWRGSEIRDGEAEVGSDGVAWRHITVALASA
jgi:hypothetical protein